MPRSEPIGHLRRSNLSPVVRVDVSACSGPDPSRLDNLSVIDVDEVSWRRGHSHFTLVSNHATGRFVWGREGNATATLDCFFCELGPPCCEEITAVSMDMGPVFDKSARKAGHATKAAIRRDPFHVVQLATVAFDKVRRGVWQDLRQLPDRGRRAAGSRGRAGRCSRTLPT